MTPAPYARMWKRPFAQRPSEERDFAKFWTGETVSLFGSQVTEFALPLTAILTLDASALQLGLLSAARFAPFIVVSLLAGVWLDRRRRRPVLIASNLGRAVLVGTIPAAAALGVLSIEWLYLIGALVGVLTVLFDIGWLSYVPSLVERGRLAAANSRLQASQSLAGVAGPGLAGFLVGALSAPVALAVDAVSYLVSAAALSQIRRPERAPAATDHGPSVRASIADGLRTVFGQPQLRSLALQSSTFNVFENVVMTIFPLYALRTLHLSPQQLGMVLGTGALGALAGSVISAPVTRRLGLSKALLASTAIGCLAPLLLLVPSGATASSLAILAAALFVHGCGIAIFNVVAVTLRQTLTPDRMLARMNASYRMLLSGGVPLGALAGGVSATAFGLHGTLAAGVVGIALTIAWMLVSPLRRAGEATAASSAMAHVQPSNSCP